MFLVSFLAVMVVIGLNLVFSGANLIDFIDMPSLLILVIVVLATLIQTGLLKDFNNSFRLTVGKKPEATFKEIKRAIQALQLVRKAASYTAVFAVCVAFVVIMKHLDVPEKIGPNFAVAVLITAYAALLNIIFFPMEKQLEVRLIEFDREEPEEKIEPFKRLEGMERNRLEENEIREKEQKTGQQ